MANIENLKPFTKENAYYYGKRGGITSGKTRRRKAYYKKQFDAYFKISEAIDNMSDIDYQDFLNDYTKAEQEQINLIFRPTKKKQRELYKRFKF